MVEVKFPHFRALEKRRIASSNTIWATLAGSKVAANALSLTEGSERTLGEIFPAVEHIQRFNLRTTEARAILNAAESDLCTMGMAYAIALHEDFVKSCLSLLVPVGLISASKVKSATTRDVHEVFERVAATSLDTDSLALFHLTRLIRNCHIHAGGEVSGALVNAYGSLTPSQVTLWEDLTKDPLNIPAVGDPAEVGVGGLIATLAVGKRLGREINEGLQSAIPRDAWADIAVGDYFANHKKSPRDPTVVRSARGYTRGLYGALALTDGELSLAVQRRLQEK